MRRKTAMKTSQKHVKQLLGLDLLHVERSSRINVLC